MRVTPAKVSLSTASAYPLNCATTFEIAARLGYDGVEVMVWTDPVSQDPEALRAPVRAPRPADRLAARADPADHPAGLGHRPVAQAAHLVRGRRWPSAPGQSSCIHRSAGSATTPAGSRSGWPSCEAEFGVAVAVENMFPWRARGRELMAYLPHWDPVGQPYEHVTLDVSHTATAGVDPLAMAEALGDRLVHLHLADGSGSAKDEHLVPGRGGAALRRAARAAGRQGLGRQRRGRGVAPGGPSTWPSGRPTWPRPSPSPGSTWSPPPA